MNFLLRIVLLLLILSGCKGRTVQTSGDTSDEIQFKYATGFKVFKINDGYRVQINHPSDHTQVFQQFFLYRTKPRLEQQNEGFSIQIPVGRVAAMATTHVGFLGALDQTDIVIGIPEPFRVFNNAIQELVRLDSIADLGESMGTDVERLLAIRPNLILKSGFPNSQESDKVFAVAGIPVIYTVAWTESTPLARAEWIRFFGFLCDCSLLADSVFSAVESRYLMLSAKADTAANKPTVFSGNSFKGSWYLPGGSSYVAHLIDDAGGNYLFSDDSSTGSRTVSFETVFQHARNAQIWLNANEQSINEMLDGDRRFSEFQPVRTGNVYNRLQKATVAGANDYFETGAWRPDLVLEDLIRIIHPGVLPDSSLHFYKKLVQ
jgi:iron complex transport system substrate-binding protein